MMKKLLTLAVAAALQLSATAQNYRESRYYNRNTNRLEYRNNTGTIDAGDIYYGLRLGPTFSTVNSDDKNLDGGSSQTGLNLGGVLGYGVSNEIPLFIETGLFYTEKGGKKKVQGKKMTYDLNYLEIPILVKYIYDMDGHFSLQPFFGGYLAWGIGGKIKNYGERESMRSFSDDTFKRFDGGLRIGCGIGYDLFYADMAYDFGLTNICHDMFDTSHNGCLYINFGINF